jgi:membrane protease YdiL (CAAX protease family)
MSTGHAWIASRKHLVIVLAVVVAVAALSIFNGLQGPVTSSSARSRYFTYAFGILLQLGWMRLVYVGLRNAGHTLGVLFGRASDWRSLGVDLLLGIVLAPLASLAAGGVAGLLGIPEPNVAFLLPQGLAEQITWVLVATAAGFGEEIVFRGYLQRQLTALLGNIPLAIAVQTVLFGVAHAYQGGTALATTGTIGLLLGLLAWWRGNIRACVVAHITIDLLGGLFN